MRQSHQREEGGVMRSLRVGQLAGRRKRQRGAEIVEFAITLVLWFIFFVLIIDMAVAMYDKSALTNAARFANRQATLYWIDPNAYGTPKEFDKDPIGNKRIKQSMIDTAVTFWSSTVIAPGGGSIVTTISPPDGPYVTTWTSGGGSGWKGVADSNIGVTLSYQHEFIGLTGFLGSRWTSPLRSEISSRVEARL